MDIVILVLLILLNGVFALSELAIVSSSRPRLQAMAEKGSRGAATALRLLEDPSRLLSTVQIGITLIGIIAGAYGATAIADDIRPWVEDVAPSLVQYAPVISFGGVIVLTTFLSLVFGELVPKRMAMAAPERLASMMAPLMALTELVAAPLVWFLRACTEGVIRLLGLHKNAQADVTEEEVKLVIAEGARAGAIETDERDMLEGVMRHADRSVRTIMTPRPEIVFLDPEMEPEEVMEVLEESGHSRFPVATGDADKIIGMVQTKDLLRHTGSGGKLDISAVMHPPIYVPETVNVMRLLEVMRGSPVRMLVITDEYGAVLGIVTGADLLESIAGDEALSEDEGLSPPVERDDGSWLIDGKTPVDELGDLVGERLNHEEESYSTVAGLVMHQLKDLPREGDKTERWPLAFEVVDMDGRRIDKVLVRRMEESETGSG